MRGGCRAGGQGGVYVVKLGGSVITRKEKPFTPRIAVLEELAKVLAELYRVGRLGGIVVGGGSYGHYVASSLQDAEPHEAVTYIHLAMSELVLLVEDVLALHGVYTLSFPPHALCKPKGLKPNCNWSTALQAVKAGVVPLTYGDVYPCEGGYCIVSGDELAVELACSIGAEGVVYVSSVPGVLDGKGAVIERLKLDEVGTAIAGRAEGFDVTGGMRRKLEAIASNWCEGLKRAVIVGPSPEHLLRAVQGERVGTEIVR